MRTICLRFGCLGAGRRGWVGADDIDSVAGAIYGAALVGLMLSPSTGIDFAIFARTDVTRGKYFV